MPTTACDLGVSLPDKCNCVSTQLHNPAQRAAHVVQPGMVLARLMFCPVALHTAEDSLNIRGDEKATLKLVGVLESASKLSCSEGNYPALYVSSSR